MTGKRYGPLCVKSDCSKNLEPDVPAGSTGSLFRKSRASGMAEVQSSAYSPIESKELT
jgi:hypothetical protein